MTSTNSLTARLISYAAVWSIIILTITWVVLSTLYKNNIEKNFDLRLEVYLKELLSNIDLTENNLPILERGLNEPSFNFPLSGWYWQISKLGNEPTDIKNILYSPSLLEYHLDTTDIGIDKKSNNLFKGYLDGPEKSTIRVIARKLAIGGSDKNYLFIIASNRQNILNDINSFTSTLAFALLLLLIGITVGVVIQVRLGLEPLKKIQAALNDIRSGKQVELKDSFPIEIKPLVDETNALLKYNRDLVERAQRNVGNLAHGLKTPISVMHNELATFNHEGSEKLVEQLNIIQKNVEHYLNRARIVGTSKRSGEKFKIEPIIDSIFRVMDKLNKAKNIKATSEYLDCKDNLYFQGEKQDFVECIGNLIENSYKWAKSKISLRIEKTNNPSPASQDMMTIIVEDDGKGLSEKQMKTALERGKRIDETLPGSGLGLSIVLDIVSIYGGTMNLEKSKLGGLKVKLTLPITT